MPAAVSHPDPERRPLGPIMLDLDGAEVTAEERELLRHPAVGGVILFGRNFAGPEPLRGLIASITAASARPPLIAVDQEGGRVQRFRDGFTLLPPAARFGALYRHDPRAALEAARAVGWLMADELRGFGIDFSFAPVVDVEQGISRVIGDRAFGGTPPVVADLAAAWMDGMHGAGMAACAKHFPGHGGVAADSHLELPEDPRPIAVLEQVDLLPYRRLIGQGLEAVMASHVRYPAIDPSPAGFSSFWLRRLLRGRLRFEGVIFSDDLDMAAAETGGGPAERALAALQAGCDMVLLCNNRTAAVAAVEAVGDWQQAASAVRLERMRGRACGGGQQSGRGAAALAALAALPAG